MAAMTHAEQVTDPIVEHGEGPVYDPSTGLMHWVDMLAGDVLSMDAVGAISKLHVGTVAAVWRPRTQGGGVVGVERGFALVDADGSVHPLPEVFTDSGLRMNEGGCDPQGRFYCGSMAYAETPGAGTLYRLDPDGSVTPVLTDVTISNGIVWTGSGDTGELVYYIDTPTHRIDVFDFDPAAATLHDRRPAVEIDPALGSPDGMTIDAEGGLWVALWGGGAVHRYSPDGELTDVIAVPATQVTACAFGGPALDQLYITTSRRDVSAAREPLAGALFMARPDVGGIPVLPFSG
jgi:sugar lactone lactonase YvrE